jgi:hypothetical protein
VAADSATAAIFSSSLSHMATPASEKYMALVGMVSLLTAGFLLLARIFKLGFLTVSLGRKPVLAYVELPGMGEELSGALWFSSKICLRSFTIALCLDQQVVYRVSQRMISQSMQFGTMRGLFR